MRNGTETAFITKAILAPTKWIYVEQSSGKLNIPPSTACFRIEKK